MAGEHAHTRRLQTRADRWRDARIATGDLPAARRQNVRQRAHARPADAHKIQRPIGNRWQLGRYELFSL
jgi:hypothetical protein